MSATAASAWTAVIAATSGSLVDLDGSGAEPAPVPGQQLVEAPRGMAGNAGEHVGEPSLRVHLVELGGHDQRRHDRGPLGASLRS